MKHAAGVRRAQQIWRAVRLVAAVMVVFTITADILADSRCRPVVRAPIPGLWGSVPSGDQDPCNTACVPDCYCCSHSVTRGPAVLPPDAGPATLTPPLLPAADPAGVRSVLYRPPLNLA